ncbi:MAG: MBL fold metallo-hydrolase [Euryarchaeota archaeon]|nr:MBL fold metallo-hydrolase [Euryarchaeota archaeon]
MPRVFQRTTGHMSNYTYLVVDEPSGKAAVVDPSFDAGPVEQIATERGFDIIAILVTHRHYDHVTDVAGLARRTGAKVYAHEVSEVPPPRVPEAGRCRPGGRSSCGRMRNVCPCLRICPFS